MKKILFLMLTTICVVASCFVISANAFSGDNTSSNDGDTASKIRVSIDTLDSVTHVENASYYYFSYGGWMATTIPESWQVENKETDKYLLQYYLYDASMFDIKDADLSGVKHYSSEVSAVSSYGNDARLATGWSGFQPLVHSISKIAATKGKIPGFESLTGDNGWYIKTQAFYEAGTNIGEGYLNAYNFQGDKYYLCLDGEIKYHNFKIAAVFSDKTVKTFDAFTIKMNNNGFVSNKAEGSIVNYNTSDFKYLTVKEDVLMSSAFGADNLGNSWSNWYRGTILKQGMKVVALGETNNYYMISYSGYNTISNTAFIPKTTVDITEKGIIATVTQSSFAYDIEKNNLFVINADEIFALSELDDTAGTVKATYEYQIFENNNYSFATKEVYLKYEDVTFDMDCAVTATAGEGGTAVSSSSTVKFNQPVKLTATANPGYSFEGWYMENTKISSKNTYSVLINKKTNNYVAKFTINTYTVTVSKEGEGTAVASDETVNYNGSVTLTATAGEGYTFKGWYNGDTVISTQSNYEMTEIKETVNVKAVFASKIESVSKSEKTTGCNSEINSGFAAVALLIALLTAIIYKLKRKQKTE